MKSHGRKSPLALPNIANGMFYADTARFQVAREILSEDKERDLIVTYQTTEDARKKQLALDTLVRTYSPLVISLAKKQPQNPHLDGMDVIQAGMEGLIKAIENIDPTRGVRLSSFAPYHIHSAMMDQDFYTRSGSTPFPRSKDARKFFFNATKQIRKLNINAKNGELTNLEARTLSATLDIEPEKLKDFAFHRANRQSVSLSTPTSEKRDDGVDTLLDALPSSTPEPSTQLILQAEEKQQAAQLRLGLSRLNERELEIITRRWMANDAQIETLTDIAHEFGVSPQRAKQIEEKAFEKLRDVFGVTAQVKAAGGKFSGPRRNSKINAGPKHH